MGRKRIHPEGTTATDRADLSLKELVKEGGARRTFRLSKEANAALKSLSKSLQSNSDTATLEYALLMIAAQLRGQPQQKGPPKLFVATSQKQRKTA
jgi:hypothetical protein